MSLTRFFIESKLLDLIDESGEACICLSKEDMNHFHVLRIKEHEHIAVIDSTQDYFELEILQISKRDIKVRIAKHETAGSRFYKVTLIQGIGKSDKFDEIVRHATEVGVDEYVPFISKRCVVKYDEKKFAHKHERWQAISKSAAMQSGRNHIPHIDNPVTTIQLAKRLVEFDNVILFWEEALPENSIEAALLETKNKIQNSQFQSIACIVGPEGGFELSEISTLKESCEMNNVRFHLATLGSSILRTETAGVVAPALLFYELERSGVL